MSELAEERSIGGGAKRVKTGVNALMHGGAGAFGTMDAYCAKLFHMLYKVEQCPFMDNIQISDKLI
ncbi:hypothetical protein [Clostridium sp. OM02-18AC]|uniref:hypothetical protein n=2 Tax=unclassified Clostridium TaxID=2614128 RepID=UPI0011C20EA3|nr:hypothetical protein [Clostridium sp. OM02-18AC]